MTIFNQFFDEIREAEGLRRCADCGATVSRDNIKTRTGEMYGVDETKPLCDTCWKERVAAGKAKFKKESVTEEKVQCPFCGWGEADPAEKTTFGSDKKGFLKCKDCGNYFKPTKKESVSEAGGYDLIMEVLQDALHFTLMSSSPNASKLAKRLGEAIRQRQQERSGKSESTLRESDDDSYDQENGDIATEDHQHWYQYGKLYYTGEASGLKAKMDADGFWPNVFFISDHGNDHLISDKKDWWK